MCNGLKDLLEKPAAQDSRNIRDFANKIGWQGLEDEANHNVQNPGRAITKAGINAALWMAMPGGGEIGDAVQGGGAALGDAEQELASQTLQQGLTNSLQQGIAQQAAQQATSQGLEQGLLSGAKDLGQQSITDELANQGITPEMVQQFGNQALHSQEGGIAANYAKQALADPAQAQGLLGQAKQFLGDTSKSVGEKWNSLQDAKHAAMYRTIPGAGSQQTAALAQQTGDFGAYGLGKTLDASSGAQGLNGFQQGASQYGGKALSLLDRAATNYGDPKTQQLMKLGQGLLSPQQQPRQMPMRPPVQGGPPQPLVQPYGSNSFDPSTLTEEQKRMLRQKGYQI